MKVNKPKYFYMACTGLENERVARCEADRAKLVKKMKSM